MPPMPAPMALNSSARNRQRNTEMPARVAATSSPPTARIWRPRRIEVTTSVARATTTRASRNTSGRDRANLLVKSNRSGMSAVTAPCRPTITRLSPASAVSMPRVAAMGEAPKTTMARALIVPHTRHSTTAAAPAGQGPQPATTSDANTAPLKPTIEPMLRSTTPASRAKPEQAPTSSGTATNEPMMVMLLVDRNAGPTHARPTTMTTSSVMAMLATAPVNSSLARLRAPVAELCAGLVRSGAVVWVIAARLGGDTISAHGDRPAAVSRPRQQPANYQDQENHGPPDVRQAQEVAASECAQGGIDRRLCALEDQEQCGHADEIGSQRDDDRVQLAEDDNQRVQAAPR